MKILFTLILTFLCLQVECGPHIVVETETGWQKVMQNRGIFSEREIDLKISCTSNDPIQWDFEGEFGEATNLWMPQITVGDVQNSSSITYKIIYDAKFTSDVSGLITCFHVLNPTIKTELFVFVSLHSSVFYENEQTFKSKGFYGVPCPVTNPTVTVSLIKAEDSGAEKIIQAPWHPVRGFPLQLNKKPGRYFCRAKGVNSKQTEEILTYKDLQLTPWAFDMNIFKDETTTFTCNSTNQKVSMTVTPNNIPVEKVYESEHGIIWRLLPGERAENITLNCFTAIANHKWRITLLDPPTIHFDHNSRNIYCNSDSANKFIQTLRCQDENHCKFFSHCLDEGEKCNKDKSSLNVHYVKKNEQCSSEKSTNTVPCVSMNFNYFNGMVRCGIANVWKTKTFFISLNQNRYFDWKNNPQEEFLRLNELSSSTNNSKSFKCEGSYYLFGRNLVFALRFSNGTTKTVPNTFFEEYRNQNPEGKYEFNGVRTLNVTLPSDIQEIDCYGYFADSKEFLKVSTSFNEKRSSNGGLSNIKRLDQPLLSSLTFSTVIGVLFQLSM